MSTKALAPAVVRVRDGQATELEGALPAFVADPEKLTYILLSEKRNISLRGVLAPTSDGFVLVGPPAADGSSDTYVLRDGSDKFEPYGKRSSEDCAYSQAACTYRGRLFAIGSALLEPNNRLFRATAMEVPEYPGDIPCDPDPEPTPDPKPTPTPDPQPEPTPNPDNGGTSQPASTTTPAGSTTTTPAAGTAARTTTAEAKTLPRTGDETAPLLAVLLAGFAAIAAGILNTRGTPIR
jgi:hypothetical protein